MILRIILVIGILTFNAFKELVDATALDQPIRLMTFAGDIIMAALALTAFGRNRGFYGQKSLFLFLALSTFTLLYNLERVGLLGHLNGIRESLFFLTSFVVLHDLLTSEEAERFKRWFTLFLIIFGLAQLPSSFLQFRQFGPSDWVGGTLGWGATNVVSQLLFLIVFYLVVLYASAADGSGFRLLRVTLIALLLAPCALNETKISFVFLPVLIVALTPMSRLYRLIPVAILGSILMYLLVSLYSEYEKDTSQVFDLKYLERYLYYDERETVDVPRFQKLMLSVDLMGNDPPTYALGMGYGLFMGGNVLDQSLVSRTLYFLRGARMYLNTIFLQGGLLGVLCLAFPLFRFVRTRATSSFAMRRFKWFLAFVLFAMWFYHDSLMNRTYAMIVGYLVIWTDLGGTDEQPAGAMAYGSSIESDDTISGNDDAQEETPDR
jgi:hypothetical protein